jgi:hypothetical protein
VDACFSALYDNYLIEFVGSCSAADSLRMRLRAAGVDLSAASTYDSSAQIIGTSVAVGTTYWDVLWFDTNASWNRSSVAIDVFSPALTAFTHAAARGVASKSALAISGYFIGGYGNRVTTPVDGFSLYPGSGTITGTVTVYGYRKAV